MHRTLNTFILGGIYIFLFSPGTVKICCVMSRLWQKTWRSPLTGWCWRPAALTSTPCLQVGEVSISKVCSDLRLFHAKLYFSAFWFYEMQHCKGSASTIPSRFFPERDMRPGYPRTCFDDWSRICQLSPTSTCTFALLSCPQ